MSTSIALTTPPASHPHHSLPSTEHPSSTTTAVPPRPSLPRRSSSLHKTLLTRLRPLPFQYIFSLWHTKPSLPLPPSFQSPSPNTTSISPSDPYALMLLAPEVPDIASFYRIFNNVPWPAIRLRDSIHFFRSGVRPLWEDEENLEGGCWVLKLRRADDSSSSREGAGEGEEEGKRGRAVRAWEEICVMCLGGMVQSEVAKERDHILGLSYSPRLYYAHISIWTKQGSNTRAIALLENAVLSGLSEDLKPQRTLKEECYYKRHEDHEGWKDVIAMGGRRR